MIGGMSMIIRTEEFKDYNEVYRLNFEAFNSREDESKLIERIRSSKFFVPELSIVAEVEEEIVGHILLSKAEIVDKDVKHEVIVLAPIAVKPSLQKRGIGGELIREGLARCRKLGYSLVLLIGHPEYYPKFGFKPARKHGIELRQFEVSDNVFMVYELIEGSLKTINGELMYPKAFFS